MIKNKILLIGNINNSLIIEYARQLQNKNIKIDFLTTSKINTHNTSLFNKIFYLQKDSIIYRIFNKIKMGKLYIHAKFKYLSLKDYESIHFHYIDRESSIIAKMFDKYTKSNIIISIWGSDLYNFSKTNSLTFLEACKTAKYITFANKSIKNQFIELTNWNQNNLIVIRFGLTPIDFIIKNSLNKDECKDKLGWDISKIAITIGYNLNPIQQHLKILENFKGELLNQYTDKILLVIPITYGNYPDYKKEIIKTLKELPFKYFIYDSFLSNDKVSILRKASDIMIQLQEHDQFSGSMQEYIFSNNIVITGEWLPYETLKENEVYYETVKSIEFLPKK